METNIDRYRKKITYQPERSLELAGTLKTPAAQPVPNGKITLMASKENLLRDTIADINGNFKFTHLYLTDTATLVLRARKGSKDSNVMIGIKQPDYPAITPAENIMPGLPTQAPALQSKY